jgi:hypothetical protein
VVVAVFFPPFTPRGSYRRPSGQLQGGFRLVQHPPTNGICPRKQHQVLSDTPSPGEKIGWDVVQRAWAAHAPGARGAGAVGFLLAPWALGLVLALGSWLPGWGNKGPAGSGSRTCAACVLRAPTPPGLLCFVRLGGGSPKINTKAAVCLACNTARASRTPPGVLVLGIYLRPHAAPCGPMRPHTEPMERAD